MPNWPCLVHSCPVAIGEAHIDSSSIFTGDGETGNTWTSFGQKSFVPLAGRVLVGRGQEAAFPFPPLRSILRAWKFKQRKLGVV